MSKMIFNASSGYTPVQINPSDYAPKEYTLMEHVIWGLKVGGVIALMFLFILAFEV